MSYSMGMNLSKFWEIVEDRGVWHAADEGTFSRRELPFLSEIRPSGLHFTAVAVLPT